MERSVTSRPFPLCFPQSPKTYLFRRQALLHPVYTASAWRLVTSLILLTYSRKWLVCLTAIFQETQVSQYKNISILDVIGAK